MIKNRHFPVDVRGIIREIAIRMNGEPFVPDFTTVARFIDNNTSALAAVVAKFYLAQISQQRSASMRDVHVDISQLIDRQFCLYARDLSTGQLLELKKAVFQAIASGFFTRIPHSVGTWDNCKLERLSNDSYTVACTMQRDIPIKRGVTRISVHTTDRFRPFHSRAL